MKDCQSPCSIHSPSNPPSTMDPISSSNVPPTAPTNNTALTLINKRIQDLNNKHNLILQKEKSLGKKRRKVRRSKYRVMGQIDELKKLSKEISSLHSCNGQLPSFNSQSDDIDIDKVNSEPRDKQRYLCISNGFAVCCLDLKQNKYQSFSNARDIPPLPEISTLNLLEEHRPISVGLFKLGPDAYVVGGQVPPPTTVIAEDPLWDENPKDSSRVTHRLSLVNGTLSLSKCNIGKLTKPKVWPIVDKIDGQIHVFDTIPSWLFAVDPSWVFSHEALNDVDDSWINIPIIRDRDKEYLNITSHSVVGDRIYALTYEGCLLFDSKMKKWEAYPKCEWRNPFSVKQVWHILDLGCARCAGEFPYGKPTDPLYVLIAVVDDLDYTFDGPDGVLALAYLVTSTGQVVCFQWLPYFYDGPVRPLDMLTGILINVDEEEKTMCAIVIGDVPDDDADDDADDITREYLFINTFTVEMLDGAASEIRQLLGKTAVEDLPVEVEQEFVRVCLNDRYVYKTGDNKVDNLRRLCAERACFL